MPWNIPLDQQDGNFMAETNQSSMAVNIPPNAPPHVYAAAAEKALEWGQPETALQVSELGLSRHPSYAGLRLFRAEALLLDKRFDEGEADLRAVLASEPQHPRAIKTLAQVLMARGRFREALPILERAEFILMGDPDIPAWLQAAESGAEEEADVVPVSFLDLPETTERLREMSLVPGIRAVSLSSGGETRSAGVEAGDLLPGMKRLSLLEGAMASVLADAGFGALIDVSVQSGDIAWTSHSGPMAALRVAADARVREGLVSWHCKKITGEGAE
jgi:tetratricopeptide (TPR) repeat protein